jgi:hypothetical protein
MKKYFKHKHCKAILALLILFFCIITVIPIFILIYDDINKQFTTKESWLMALLIAIKHF